jgi:hypothetical protein
MCKEWTHTAKDVLDHIHLTLSTVHVDVTVFSSSVTAAISRHAFDLSPFMPAWPRGRDLTVNSLNAIESRGLTARIGHDSVFIRSVVAVPQQGWVLRNRQRRPPGSR